MREGTRERAGDDGPAAFLGAHPPFDALSAEQLERVAASAMLESFAAGEVVFEQGARALCHLRVVRDGAIEIVAHGHVLDVLGEGELFGYASMLSGLPAGFTARAASATSCYRIEAEEAQALLAGPDGLRFVARSLLEEPTELHVLAREPARNAADQPVGSLIRSPPVVCSPDTTIRETARTIGDRGATAAVVDLGERGFGILTDRDLRTRVVAAGLSGDEPVAAAMSAPAYTCGPDRSAGDVLLEMLDRGLRHCPVVSAAGTVLGVVDEVDLVTARTRTSFYLRQRIAAASGDEELVRISRELRPMVIALHDARLASANVMAVYAVCVDALVRRLLELALARHGRPGVEFAWLALGSQARREALPGSDVDSAIVWFDPRVERATGAGGATDAAAVTATDAPAATHPGASQAALLAIARDVLSAVRACGLATDAHGVSAESPPFVRSVSSWRALARGWITDPTQEKALILSSVMLDSRPVWGVHTGTPVADAFRLAQGDSDLLRLLARFALSHRPSAGRVRGLLLEHDGERRGLLDLKRGALVPILDLARWGAFAAGITVATTPERLRAAGEAGTLAPDDAHTLLDAFELINDLRLDHQAAALRAGRTPDDHIDPGQLSSLMRGQLRQALRAVAAIQRRVADQLDAGGR